MSSAKRAEAGGEPTARQGRTWNKYSGRWEPGPFTQRVIVSRSIEKDSTLVQIWLTSSASAIQQACSPGISYGQLPSSAVERMQSEHFSLLFDQKTQPWSWNCSTVRTKNTASQESHLSEWRQLLEMRLPLTNCWQQEGPPCCFRKWKKAT